MKYRYEKEEKISAKDLRIDLESKKEEELFKWFLACLLFGKPIQQDVAKRTYFEFIEEGLITPQKIIDAGWDKLVEILDRGHYVRYDFSTATKLLGICRNLTEKYGTLTNLFKQSKNIKDLENRLQEFKSVGPVTTRIFLRDIKPIFEQVKNHE